MNKIYKVIWSKVKHQYVVVSELAHSNGKQSRTSRNSIRSRIAALVVCGAITAFGAFGALPMDSVYAADSTVQQATQTQYVAFKAGANDRIGRTKNFGDTSNPAWYTCTSVRIDENTTVKYWVRNGYKLEVEPDAPYIPERLMLREDGKVVDYRINAVLENPELLESQQPILQTTQSFSTGTNTQTTRGDSLEKIEVGYYAGVSNSAGVGTDGTWNYIIDPKMNGNFDDYIDTNPTQATNVKDSGYWKEVTERAGSYYLGNQKVDSKNVYVIDGETGVFVTTPNGNEVYTGKVYGSHNEILMTGKDENGNYYSYWAAKSDDDNVSIGDSDLTLGDYRNNLQTLERNDRKLAAADIKSVKVDTGNNRINLITNTQFDENGEPIEGTEGTITGFSVNSIKNTGEDTKIQFSDGENNKFDVDAGSRVVATKFDENEKVSELSINGETYAIGGGETYTNGNGIAIDDKNDNKISVVTGNGLGIEDGKVVAKAGTNVTIDENGINAKDTTLVGGEITPTTSEDGYENTYEIKDTDENKAILKDVASATKLSSVDSKVGDTQYTSTNYIANGQNLTTAASNLDSAIKGNENKIVALDGRVVNVENDTITGGSIDTDGKINLRQKDGTSITTDNAIHDWKVTDANLDENGTLTLNTENAYGGDTGSVTVDNIASRGYVTNQIDANNTTITQQYENYFNTNDKYLSGATFDNNSGELKLTVAKAGENGAAQEYSFDLGKYVEGKDVYVNQISIDKENNKLILNRKNATSLELGLEELSSIGVSSSDYQLIGSGDGTGTYTPDESGNISLQVKDSVSGEVRTVQLTDVASANTLKTVSDRVGDTNYSSTNYIHNEDNLTTAASTLDSAIKATADKVDAGWALYSDGNKIKDVKPGDNWISVDAGENVSISKNENGNGLTISADLKDLDVEDTNAVLYDDDDKTTVTLAGTNGTRITNVAKGDISEKSTEAVNGSQLYATNQKVDAGWTATDGKTGITVSPTNNTLKFAGDNNIAVTADAENNAINVELNPDVNLKGEGKNSDNRVWLSGSNGTITVTTENNLPEKTTVINGGNVYVGSSVSVGDKVEITDKDITGLSNTEWNGTTTTPDRAATEGQLQSVATEAAKHTTVSGDENITVKHEEGSQDYQVTLNPDVTLKGDNSSIELNGTKGTMQVNQETTEGTDFTNINGNVVSIGYTNKEGTKNAIVIDGGEGTITGLSNTTWDGKTDNASRVATEGQLEDLSDTVNTGWIATDSQNHEVNITPDNNKLNFAGDENITVTAANNEIKTTLNDDIVLGDYLNGDDGVLIGGSSGTISATNSITVGEDQGLIIDGQKKEIQGLSNTTWNEKIANDAAVEGSTAASTAATQGQLQEVSKVANAGWTASDGTNSISVKPNETLNFVGDENLTVSADGTDKELKVSLNDDITLGDGENAIKIDGTNGTLNIGSTFAVAEDGTVLSDGDVIADADGEKYSLSEVGKYAVRYDKTNDGTSTITLADGDDLSGTRIKNVADGVDPKDAVNVSQLEAVEATANAGWTASDGTNSISIKPNETLNFVGDENLTVSADGTDKKLKVSLNDDITLGNTEAGNTEGERSFTINTTDPNGYVPESYKTGSGANFIEENGGFMLFATDTQGFGVFGVTAKGSAWARDFKTYTTDIYGNNTQYSLNEVGDAVAQMSSYYNGKNSYTVFSRYLNEAEKDNPFVTVDEDGNTINATRDIPLALRDDGAVLIGATIKGEDFTDNGIRINAETKTTYDENGNEVTNNIATITGLENTEWKPPTPVATFAANDGSATVTSRAATESQLNDLYSAVAAYDVNVDGTIDYSHIALAGTPYGASRSGNGTHTGGTSITNVAYASGKDGSEAVNVDYLNDAINNAVKDGGAISDSDRHLQEGTYHVNDQGKVELIVADEKGENQSTVTIDNIANKNDITNLDNKIDNTFNDLNDKINNIDNVETDVKGGNINEDGTISLKTENEDGTTTNVTLKGQLTDSGVVQEGTTFDKETGTLTITSQDKYSGETSSVTVEGIASTEVVGATTKEDLATAYKDADKDGNATTEYITDSESMVEADVALDHAIQDVAGTSYANDMVLSNRIDSVEKRLGNVEERIDKVGAMAAAIANLRTMGFDPEAPTEIAIGVGQYKSETGIAIGVFHYPNQDFMLSASLSSSGDELMGGIGATWKLGRKSAAERAKDEEARHLEQAEEMKKLAQQEKVKAQAQRHAKLLAERQQASQKNA